MTLASDRLSMIDGEASLATRAAWLYFAAGMTQSEIASRLNIQSTKAHRLIARASREGMIRVFVEGPVAECVALENTLGPALRALVLPRRAGPRRGRSAAEGTGPRGRKLPAPDPRAQRGQR